MQRLGAVALTTVLVTALGCQRATQAPPRGESNPPEPQPLNYGGSYDAPREAGSTQSAECEEVADAGLDTVGIYCRFHRDPCCLPGGGFHGGAGWGCNNANYVDWYARACREGQ